MNDILLLIGRSLRNALRQPATILPNIAISVFFLFVYNSGLSSVAAAAGVPGHVPGLHPPGDHRLGGGRRRRPRRADAHQGHRQRLLHQAPADADAAARGDLGADDRERDHPHGPGRAGHAASPWRWGSRSRRDPPGSLLVVVLAFLWGMAFAGYAAFMALKTKNAAAAQAATFAFFPLIFLSYTFVPKEYVTAGWLKVAATINPTTYVFDSMRSLLNTGWDSTSLLVGFAVTFGFATLTGDHGALGGARRDQAVVGRPSAAAGGASARPPRALVDSGHAPLPPHPRAPSRGRRRAAPARLPQRLPRAERLGVRRRHHAGRAHVRRARPHRLGHRPRPRAGGAERAAGPAGAGRRRVGGQAAARRPHDGQRPRPRGRADHRRRAAADGHGADLAARRARRLSRRRRGVLPPGRRRHPAAARAGRRSCSRRTRSWA